MKAWAVVRNGEPLEPIERPALEPKGNEVLVDVTHAGVCHSDLHFWKGYYDLGGGKTLKLTDRGVVLPRAPGHEVVGKVAKLGPQASGVSVGESCIVFPWLGCGTCERCLRGDDNLCDKPNAIGVLQDGGFGSQVIVPHAKYLVPVGDLDPGLAATFACSGVTVYSAIKKIMPLPADDPIVLIGAGGLGLQAIGMLKALGHRNIVSVDISAEKRAAALEMGASKAIEASGSHGLNKLLEATGGPVKAAIDFVNMSGTAQLGLDCLAKAGKLVLVGIGGGEMVVSLASMIFKPRTVQGSATGNPQDLRDVVALAKAGKLRPIPLTKMAKSDVNRAIHMLEEGKVTGRIILEGQS
jgi:alcohol dehydrogenase/propanol-preferring alcohol dehydrogenase